MHCCRCRLVVRHSRHSRHGPPGFTLIELMIALALLGILAAIALPTFFEQMARARRADAQAALLEDAGYMQRYYSAHNAYADTPPPALPAATSPRGGAASYRIDVAVPADDPTSFVLTATRTGAMRADRCGDFTYDNLGRRDLVAGTAAAGLDAASCWR
ncbi:MAG: type IV pilin protein [Betaproteobacteria bacterium]